MSENDILHCDANNFYASVEIAKDPSLKGKNLVVCGDPEKRHGIVLAKSEGAKARGVKTGDTVWQAKQKCSDLIFLPPDFQSYLKYSKALFEIYTSFTDRVERFGLDECWLDVKGSHSLFGPSEKIAESIRRRAREELGLTVSVGISFTKVFAKLGSDYKKPDAQTLISRENYKTIAWDLPVQDILMVGKSAMNFFKSVGILTIGDLANANAQLLKSKIGQMGLTLKNWANGEENDPVKLYYEKREPESIGNGATASRDLLSTEECETFITSLAERVAYRLRKHEKAACGIHVTLKFSDLSTVGKQTKTLYPTASATDLVATAKPLFLELWGETRRPIRAITLTAIYLLRSDDYAQSSLFGEDERSEKHTRFEKTVDVLREKYGSSILLRASLIQDVFDADEYDEETKPFNRN